MKSSEYALIFKTFLVWDLLGIFYFLFDNGGNPSKEKPFGLASW